MQASSGMVYPLERSAQVKRTISTFRVLSTNSVRATLDKSPTFQ